MSLNQPFAPITVVEMLEFVRATQALMDDVERDLLIDYLAYHPAAGDLVPGTGGLRKLRWGMEGRGKRGGARVVYYFHDATIPLFAIAAYAKNQKADLSQAERNDFKRLISLIVAAYKKGN